MQAVAGLLGLFALVVTWILVARHGRKAGWGAMKRHAIGAVAGFVLMIIVTLIFAPPAAQVAEGASPSPAGAATPVASPAAAEREKAKRLDDIKGMASGIEDVLEVDDGHLNITQIQRSIWDEKAWANSISMWPHEFLKDLTAEYPGRYKEVAIRFVVPTKDKYGNESSAEAMTLTYDMGEIAKVNWKGATPFDILDLAQVYVRPIGRTGVDAWCADGNSQFAEQFCAHSAR